jgi:Tfp pilus assembly major pilin PilA
VDFSIWLVVSPKGSSMELNEDGSAKTLNEGTYITYDANSSGIDSGTITISAGEILRLDKKYLPSDVVYNTELTSQVSKLEAKIPSMNNYYTKKQVDAKIPSLEGYYTRDEVAKQIAAILPEFSAADEGKVLGIQNGVLAWVTAVAAQPDDGSGEDNNASTAYIDGSTLVVDGTVDGTTLAVNGTVDNGTLRLSSGAAAESTVDGGTLAVSGTVTEGTLSISGTVANTTLIL